MTESERDRAEREGLMWAAALVERYQNENWRRLRVNDICSEIRRLINAEVAYAVLHSVTGDTLVRDVGR